MSMYTVCNYVKIFLYLEYVKLKIMYKWLFYVLKKILFDVTLCLFDKWNGATGEKL